jgi:hypothetical protein
MPRRTSGTAEEIADSVTHISDGTRSLIGEELGVLRRDLEGRVRTSAGGLAMLGAAGALSVGAFATATGAIVSLLGRTIPRGLASAVVAGAYGGGAAWLATEGMRRMRVIDR